MNILISGAGIAGLTLAYWLHKLGFTSSVIERRPDLSDEGYMIDFYGAGYDMAEKMDLLPALEARHYPVTKIVYVDGRGRPRASLNVDRFRKMLHHRHFNFMRGDLETVLCQAIENSVPIQFGTSIAAISPQPDRVHVELTDGTSRDADLVVGADGIHSNVRTLVWGNESQFERFLGYYVACSIIENFLGVEKEFSGRIQPGVQALAYSIRGNRLATLFVWKSERLDVGGRQEKIDALARACAGMDWIVPRLIEAARQSSHLYFDPVSQISLSLWHQGRVVLVGDACQCLTLLAGQGASMAMAGAYILAEELHRAAGDHQAAFQAYQDRLKPEIDRRQAEARKLAGAFVPKSRLSILLALLFLQVAYWPGFRSQFLREIGATSIIK